MTPKTRAESAKAGATDPNPTQTIKSKSEDTETLLQDTANAAANVSAAVLDSIEPVDPQESAKVPSPTVLSERNGRRRRNACSERFSCQYIYRRRTGLPTEDELEVAEFLVTEDFRSRWASGSASEDELVAASIMVQMKKDPNYSAPVQKVSWPNCNQTRRDPSS